MAKKLESKWVCVSAVGAVVPKEDGGSICLKRGDTIEGEYYEQVVPKVQGLVREGTLDKRFRAQLEKERRRRSGEQFPEDWADAKKGIPDDFDPRFDKPGDPAENLGNAIREETGKDRIEKQP